MALRDTMLLHRCYYYLRSGDNDRTSDIVSRIVTSPHTAYDIARVYFILSLCLLLYNTEMNSQRKFQATRHIVCMILKRNDGHGNVSIGKNVYVIHLQHIIVVFSSNMCQIIESTSEMCIGWTKRIGRFRCILKCIFYSLIDEG